jgi:hypothetical protein
LEGVDDEFSVSTDSVTASMHRIYQFNCVVLCRRSQLIDLTQEPAQGQIEMDEPCARICVSDVRSFARITHVHCAWAARAGHAPASQLRIPINRSRKRGAYKVGIGRNLDRHFSLAALIYPEHSSAQFFAQPLTDQCWLCTDPA